MLSSLFGNGMIDTLRLGGIKLSGELVQIDIHESNFSAGKFAALLRKIAEAEITIPHLHQRKSGKVVHSTLCLAADDFSRMQRDADCLFQESQTTLLPAVGTITLFPHRSAVEIFTQVLQSLALHQIPLYGISTSVSALVIHTDYSLLDKGVEAILQVCELPENHTPLRPVVLLGDQAVETVAVYWEPRIRIYGMDVQHDLSRLRLQCAVAELSSPSWGKIGLNKEKFRLLLVQRDAQGDLCCDLFVDSCWKESLSLDFHDFIAKQTSAYSNNTGNVDVVSFHGPHFQDRSGIAERIFAALREGGINPVSSGCTGTSVHVVVRAGEGDSTAEWLRQICMIPSRDDK